MPNHAYGILYPNLWGYTGTDAWYRVWHSLTKVKNQCTTMDMTFPSRSCYATWEQHPTMGMWFPFWILPGSKTLVGGQVHKLLTKVFTDRVSWTSVRSWSWSHLCGYPDQKTKQNQGLIQEESFTYVSLKGISSIVEIKFLTVEWAGGKAESCKNPYSS